MLVENHLILCEFRFDLTADGWMPSIHRSFRYLMMRLILIWQRATAIDRRIVVPIDFQRLRLRYQRF